MEELKVPSVRRFHGSHVQCMVVYHDTDDGCDDVAFIPLSVHGLQIEWLDRADFLAEYPFDVGSVPAKVAQIWLESGMVIHTTTDPEALAYIYRIAGHVEDEAIVSAISDKLGIDAVSQLSEESVQKEPELPDEVKSLLE